MKLLFTIFFFASFQALYAQDVSSIIKQANDAYKKGDYKNAVELYKNALKKNAGDVTAKFNLGNALQKQNDAAGAEKYYTEVTDVNDISLKAKALYNKGLSLVQQQKLQDAIENFKQSLTLVPGDNETRENLQKAINELKQKQQSTPPPNAKNLPKPQQNKNTKQPDKEMIEQKFNELRDKEKQLQKSLQKKNNTAQPEKDW
ncbi:MAG TPA: tetratricopeptide repeat protein [Panacibacter sp.]|nr:tetratricopeptide repeat protein [Panacibacter sp.]